MGSVFSWMCNGRWLCSKWWVVAVQLIGGCDVGVVTYGWHNVVKGAPGARLGTQARRGARKAP